MIELCEARGKFCRYTRPGRAASNETRMPELLMPEFKPLIGLVALLGALALAACATTSSTPQPMPVARTPEQIKADCWMKYENDPKMSLDKRVTVVDQCIAERSRAQAPIN
jgi:hypothetical protein